MGFDLTNKVRSLFTTLPAIYCLFTSKEVLYIFAKDGKTRKKLYTKGLSKSYWGFSFMKTVMHVFINRILLKYISELNHESISLISL